MFRDFYKIAWAFHRNTSRWPHNTLSPDDEQNVIPYFKEYLSANIIPLPEVELPTASLASAISKRASCRSFKNSPVGIESLSILLKGAYGILEKTYMQDMEFYERPVPSGGGLYSMELYVLSMNIATLEEGIYHYAPTSHSLEHLKSVSFSPLFISNLFMHQPYLSNCAAIIIISSVVERNMKKYADRGYRYILFEAGHCVQNMNLLSSAMDLGTLNLGGFFDSDLAQVIGIELEEEVPLYCMAVGVPQSISKTDIRLPDPY